MKKFKFQRKKSYRLIISFIIFISLFIWISFKELNTNHSTLVKLLIPNTENISFFHISDLIKTMEFNKKSKAITNPTIYFHSDSDMSIFTMLKDNLRKLGIEARIDTTNTKTNLYYICYGNISDTILIQKKIYAKIQFSTNKLNNYLKLNYPSLYNEIVSDKNNVLENTILILVGNKNAPEDAINNSTEIIALVLYNFLGD